MEFAEWHKQAQVAVADAGVSLLDKLKDGLADTLNIDEQHASALTNGLIGAALGGLGGGLAGGAYAEEGEGVSNALRTAGIGALTGGLAGGAGTYAHKLLTGGRQFEGELNTDEAGGPVNSLTEAAGDLSVANPLTALGAVWSGVRGAKVVDSVLTDPNTKARIENAIRGGVDTIHTVTTTPWQAGGKPVTTTINGRVPLRGIRERLAHLFSKDNIPGASRGSKPLGTGNLGSPLWRLAGSSIPLALGYMADKYIQRDN